MCNCVCTSTHHDIRHKVLSLQGFWELWSLFQFTSLPLDTRATAGIWTDWNGLEPTGDTSNLSGSANVRINISTATAATLVLSRRYPHQRTPRLPLAGSAWFDPLGLPCPSQKRPVLVESPVPGWQTPDSESRLNQGATKCYKGIQGLPSLIFPHMPLANIGGYSRLSDFLGQSTSSWNAPRAPKDATVLPGVQWLPQANNFGYGAKEPCGAPQEGTTCWSCAGVFRYQHWMDGWMDARMHGCTDDHDLVEENQKESSGELCSDNTLRVNSTSEKTVWREDYKCLPLLK